MNTAAERISMISTIMALVYSTLILVCSCLLSITVFYISWGTNKKANEI